MLPPQWAAPPSTWTHDTAPEGLAGAGSRKQEAGSRDLSIKPSVGAPEREGWPVFRSQAGEIAKPPL